MNRLDQVDQAALRGRLETEFLALTAIDSLSFRERGMADALMERLHALGFDTILEDRAGEAYGGNAGNVYGFLKGELPGEPILLVAHMDTVEPGCGKRAVLHPDGTITSDESSVLGADDVAGLVEILEGIRLLQEAHIPHRDVEVLFPIGEELYDKGTKQLDFSQIKAKEAYVLDLSGAVGAAALRAPSILSFQITIRGKAAHAGFEPEKGIHAIALMSRAITGMAQGRIDEETTLNIGCIEGGTMSNIVPQLCTCQGEVRSFSHAKALQCVEEIDRQLAELTAGTGASYELETTVHIEAYRIKRQEPLVRRFEAACARLGLSGRLEDTFGGSDNNLLVKNGIRGIVLSCGMYQVHSVKEYTSLEQLERGARLIAELLSSQL